MAWWYWLIANKAFSILLLGNLVALLNGVLPYMPTGGFRTGMEKFVMVLRWILDRVAPTVAKDSPGTFKVPFFSWSKPPANGTAPAGFKQAGYATSTMLGILATVALIATLLIACISIGGCAWWNKTAGPAIFDCGTEAMTKVERDLLSVIASVLKDQNWEEELLGLSQQLGADGIAMVACIVEHIVNPTPSLNAKLGTRRSADVVSHGTVWLAKHPAGRR